LILIIRFSLSSNKIEHMKKTMLLVWCLLLGTLLAAQNITVQGNITRISDGAPVANWLVFAYSNQDTAFTSFGFGNTDASGNYQFQMDISNLGSGTLYVSTYDACYDPSGMPINPNGIEIAFTQPGNPVVANFQICNDVPQAPECTAHIYTYSDPTGYSVQFEGLYYGLDSTTVGTTYVWDFGDGTTGTGPNPQHTYTADGFYPVILTVTGSGGCIATASSYVQIGQIGANCYAYFYYTTTNVPNEVQFFGSYINWPDSSQSTTYLWDFGDGSTSTELNPVHQYANPGLYVVTFTATGADGCTSTINYLVDTQTPPQPECQAYFWYEQSDTLTFSFNPVYYSLSGSPLTAASYLWDFGDGSTSTESNPTHTYADEGVYNVLLTVVSPDSCVAYASNVVFIYDGWQIDTFFYGCQAMFGVDWGVWDSLGMYNPNYDPLHVHFYDASFGAVQSWNWNFGDGTTSTEQNPAHTYAQEGEYTVTLAIETLDGCESEVSFLIYVGNDTPWNPELDCQALFFPLPDSLGGTGLHFLDLSYSVTPIASWNWNFGDGTSSNEQNPYHQYAQPGEYTVTLSITSAPDSLGNPVCNSEISFVINTEDPWNFNAQTPSLGRAAAITAVNDPKSVFEQMTLVPNPAISETNVLLESAKALEAQIRVTDLNGRTLQLQQQSVQAGANRIRVDVSKLPAGMYLLEVRSAEGVTTGKLMVQN
jgi:PKD repeat protein